MDSIIVAFQGVLGANSELAIRQHFGSSVEAYPCHSLNDMFEAFYAGKVTYCLLPVENAMAGAVNKAYELLMDADLRIQADVILHVHHALVAPPGVQLSDIKYVRSHPQALAQCEHYLQRNGFEGVMWHDTAGAAADLSQDPQPHTAAIANEYAGKLYKLDILESNIEDVQFNFTRFFVLGNDDPPKGEYNKTSIVFATRHRPAALYDCLGEFASRGLNLTKIESRPRRNRPWEPVFYMDFEGHWQDPDCQEALSRLLQRASFVKMLGSYPAVKTGREWVGI